MSSIPDDCTKVLLRAPGNNNPIQVGWKNKNGVLVFGSVFAFDLKMPITGWMPLPDIEDPVYDDEN